MKTKIDERTEEQKKSDKRYYTILFILAVILISILVPIKHYVGYISYTPSESMCNTLQVGDLSLVTRNTDNIERYDIISFKETNIVDYGNKNLVKRVIGLPGEHLDIVDGKVYVNGSSTPLDDSFALVDDWDGSYDVPDNYYFVMGDNRSNSLDSRYVGCIPTNCIHGKFIVKIASFKKPNSIGKNF